MKNRIVILYDGLRNSVFQGQVLQPLIKHLNAHPNERGIIISFEKTKPSKKDIRLLIPDPRITLITLRKLPFFGSLALRYAAYQLQPILHQYYAQGISSIVTRGPLAAWIVGNAKITSHIPLTIQARGLAAEEYRYAHTNYSRFMRWFHYLRIWQYKRIEQWVYGTYACNRNVTIRTVSSSLKQYLIETFHAPFSKIKMEQADIPPHISKTQKRSWHNTIRKKLNIPKDAYVYVYNGSAKPWQCPEQTVEFFAQKYYKNQNCFLLLLTQDVVIFNTLLLQHQIPSHAFHITHVAHSEMYKFLAAANAGIILREPDVINWVSRPTKVLEYRAVGLKIIHNNTIGMLRDN